MHTQWGHWTLSSFFTWILFSWLDIPISESALNSQPSSLQEKFWRLGSWCNSQCFGVLTSLHSGQISLIFFSSVICFWVKCMFKDLAECVLKSQRSHMKGLWLLWRFIWYSSCRLFWNFLSHIVHMASLGTIVSGMAGCTDGSDSFLTLTCGLTSFFAISCLEQLEQRKMLEELRPDWVSFI